MSVRGELSPTIGPQINSQLNIQELLINFSSRKLIMWSYFTAIDEIKCVD